MAFYHERVDFWLLNFGIFSLQDNFLEKRSVTIVDDLK